MEEFIKISKTKLEGRLNSIKELCNMLMESGDPVPRTAVNEVSLIQSILSDSTPIEDDEINLTPEKVKRGNEICFDLIDKMNKIEPQNTSISEDFQCKCDNEIKTGQTSVMCCNICGKPDEEFWRKG